MEAKNIKSILTNLEELAQKIAVLEKEIQNILNKKEELEKEASRLLVLALKTEDWNERCKFGKKSDALIKECWAIRDNLAKLENELKIAKNMQNNIVPQKFNAEETNKDLVTQR